MAPTQPIGDRLTRLRREQRFSAGLVPVESTIGMAATVHVLDRGKLGRGEGRFALRF